MNKTPLIAVDGPAASGKGTVASALARHFDIPYLDTGLLYRAVGVQAQREGGLEEIIAQSAAQALDTADPLAGFVAEFALPEGVIYLNGNSLGPAPKAALASAATIAGSFVPAALTAAKSMKGFAIR